MTDTAELRKLAEAATPEIKLAELAKVFANATGHRTRDYGEVSGDNFQMMTMHENPEELARMLSTVFVDATAELTALRAKVKSQAEALAPFAKEYAEWHNCQHDGQIIFIGPEDGLDEDYGAAHFTVGDLRRAAQEAGHE